MYKNMNNIKLITEYERVCEILEDGYYVTHAVLKHKEALQKELQSRGLLKSEYIHV